jgi:hypothetical protein
MTELERCRRERDRLERKLDELAAKHGQARRVARWCVTTTTETQYELDRVLDSIRRLKP